MQSVLIMPAACYNHNVLLLTNMVDKAVRIIYPATPGLTVFEWFWFSDTIRQSVPLDVFEQFIDAFQCLFVLHLPV